MDSATQTGQKGEQLAREYLIQHGYEVLHTNWRSGHWEVDIVALKNNILVFVEVKTRRSAGILAPYKAVDINKQKLIAGAAQNYITRHNESREVRFDVISVLHSGSAAIEHIEDAYRSYAR